MAERTMPFFKFDGDEWLTGKIQLLTAEEKGIFIDLIARIWKEKGKLQNDEILHRLIRVEKATLSKALKAFFEIGIMEDKDGFLSVKFIDEQISNRLDYIVRQSEIGHRGGRPKKGSKPKQKAESRKKKKEEVVEEERAFGGDGDSNPSVARTGTDQSDLTDGTDSAGTGSDGRDQQDGQGEPTGCTPGSIAHKLWDAYPKKFAMLLGQKAALKTIKELHSQGKSYEEIETMLMEAVQGYSEAVQKWSQKKRQYVWSMETFFEAGHYADDPECWRDEDDQAGQTSPVTADPYVTLPDGSKVRRSVL